MARSSRSLSKRILQPLGMTSAIDLDEQTLGPPDAAGYTRFALGPAAPGAAGGPRLAVRGWGTGHDRARPGAVGHLSDRAQAAEARVVRS